MTTWPTSGVTLVVKNLTGSYTSIGNTILSPGEEKVVLFSTPTRLKYGIMLQRNFIVKFLTAIPADIQEFLGTTVPAPTTPPPVTTIPISVDLSNYVTKTELSNYAAKTELTNYALASHTHSNLHSHLNKTVLDKLSQTGTETNIDLSVIQMTLNGSGAPAILAEWVGQEYLDTTNHRWYKAFGTSLTSDWVEVTLGSPAPVVPVVTVTVSDITETTATINWTITDSTNVVSYDIWHDSNFVVNVNSTTTTYLLTGLGSGHTHTFYVRALDSTNTIICQGSVQAHNTVTGDTTPPSEVTNLAANNVTSTSLALSWTASASSDISSYDVYQETVLLGNTPGTSYDVIELSGATTYTFTVKSRDAVNNISKGTSVTTTTM